MRRLLLLVCLTAACIALGAPTRTLTAAHRAHVSGDLMVHKATRPHARTSVIVHGSADAVKRIADRHGLRILRMLKHEAVLEANGAQIDALSLDGEVEHLSGDLPVQSTMSVTNKATAADQVWAGTSGLLGIGAIAGANGSGIGIALLDSGISTHPALKSKVLASVSFVTGDPDTSDSFGHGTHIAGIIAGKASAASGITTAYTGGVAPGASLVNVRVLNDQGSGLTSDVINGVDWVIDHKSQYNIRVINLSLGHTVTESATTDPLCLAVKRAVDAGIVVVASAGNRGKAEDGSPILGGITSPGNSPYAITVGALNTWGTVSRGDDTVTTYSSRGPTPIDHAVKPDLVAPGNKIVSLEASGSYLSLNYPAFHKAGSPTNAYMTLSGTSMSAGVVSAGAALLLQRNPGYKPAQIKLLLQTGSSYMTDGGLIAAGAGSVNLWSSRRAEVNGLDDLLSSLPLIGGLFATPGGVAYWDAGSMSTRIYQPGGIRLLGLGDLVSALLNPLGLGWDTLLLVGSNNPVASLGPKRILWGDVSYWTQGNYVIWGDTILTPEGNYVIWGDTQMTDGYYVIWGDSTTAQDPH
jgi:serine protease AprX